MPELVTLPLLIVSVAVTVPVAEFAKTIFCAEVPAALPAVTVPPSTVRLLVVVEVPMTSWELVESVPLVPTLIEPPEVMDILLLVVSTLDPVPDIESEPAPARIRPEPDTAATVRLDPIAAETPDPSVSVGVPPEIVSV